MYPPYDHPVIPIRAPSTYGRFFSSARPSSWSLSSWAPMFFRSGASKACPRPHDPRPSTVQTRKPFEAK